MPHESNFPPGPAAAAAGSARAAAAMAARAQTGKGPHHERQHPERRPPRRSGPNWWLPDVGGGSPPYDVGAAARAGGLTCPHGGMRCESIACIDFGCIATETPTGQQALGVE